MKTMRFNSINIYSAYRGEESETKCITRLIRDDSAHVCDLYLRLLHYYDNNHCKSLNIACDENSKEIFLEKFYEGFPIVHIPFSLDDYKKLEGISISEYWLSVIIQAIEYVGNLWGWDLDFFESISLKVKNQFGADKGVQ